MVETLEDTIPYMKGDYRNRAIAELLQLNIRIKGIQKMLKEWEDGTLTYIPSNPKELSEKQLEIMLEYQKILRERIAYVVGIKDNPNEKI